MKFKTITYEEVEKVKKQVTTTNVSNAFEVFKHFLKIKKANGEEMRKTDFYFGVSQCLSIMYLIGYKQGKLDERTRVKNKEKLKGVN